MSVGSGGDRGRDGGDERGRDPDFSTEDFVEGMLGEPWSVRRMVMTMVPLLTGLAVLQMISGAVLGEFEEVLLTYPALLILVPVQIGTAGNFGSIMCSRLSTEMHLGVFELSPTNPGVQATSGGIVGLGLTVYTIVGLAAWGIARGLGGTLGLVEVMTISLVSGMLLVAFVIGISLAAVPLSFRLGFNPDDTTIPIVTNVADITGVLVLFAVVVVVV